jgi:hypothetical protein
MSDVHFEIFRQNHATGSWALVEVLENRDQALERARRMLHDGRATAVRVVKETFDPETGGYISLNLFEDGRVNTKKKNTKIDELDALPVCDAPEHLYGDSARAVIGRTLGEWLAPNKLTVIELLHSAAALQKLDSHGQTLQHALQKIAVARAFGSDKPVTKFIRGLNELCSAGIRRVYKDDKSGLFEGGEAGKFGALAETLSGSADALYRLNGVLTKYLKVATTWDAKLALLLGLMNELPEEDEPQALLLGAIDALVSEIVATPAALADLLGTQPDLGHTLLNLVALFLGNESSERPAAANALAGYLKRDMLSDARAMVAARLLSELRSVKRLCPSSWDKEVLMLRRLANALVQACGKYLAHEDVIEAFTDRSRRFVTHEPLFQYLQDARSPDEKVARLLTVEENIIGAENKRELATFILPHIALHAFEEQLGNGVLAKLKRVTELQGRVLRSGFQELQKNQLATALDGVAKSIEERAKLLSSIETRFANPIERAQALLKLAGAGALTQGDVQMKARKMLMAALASPGFFPAYVAQQQQGKERPPTSDMVLQKLTTELRAFGLTYEEALRVLAIQNVVLI